jgi:hypothetical protein
MNRTKRTDPPPALGDISPSSLRQLAKEIRRDASRWLSRANDLDAAAERLEVAQ